MDGEVPSVDKKQLFERFLDHLINPNDCIDTFGRTYFDDLELIAVENHGFDPASQTFPDPAAQEWFERVRSEFGFRTLDDFIAYARDNHSQLDIANYRPRSSFHGNTIYDIEPSFRTLQSSAESVDAINEFQKRWSMRGVGDIPENDVDADYYELYLSYDRVNPWTFLIGHEIRRKTLLPDDNVICIGNRWLGEILYFRQNLGLRKAVGVDLFSPDSALVVEADMHKLPFEDNSVKLIFTRGLINKSYDVRLWAGEMMRVLADGGFIITETPGPYGYGVNSLTRTDVKSARNLMRLFSGKISRVVYADESQPRRFLYDGTRLVRVFIQIDKSGNRPLPEMEPFPHVAFAFYNGFRNLLLKVRYRLRHRGLWPREKRAS